MNDLCEGFSKESKRVPVLYCENCCAEADRERSIKQKTIKILFIQCSPAFSFCIGLKDKLQN
jgi:hypothetical protein